MAAEWLTGFVEAEGNCLQILVCEITIFKSAAAAKLQTKVSANTAALGHLQKNSSSLQQDELDVVCKSAALLQQKKLGCGKNIFFEKQM